MVAPELPDDGMDLDEPVHEEDAADVKARKLQQQEERRLAEERKKSKVGGFFSALSPEIRGWFYTDTHRFPDAHSHMHMHTPHKDTLTEAHIHTNTLYP